LVDGNGNNVIHIKDRYTPLEVFEGMFDTIVNLSHCPHKAVFKFFKDIYLPGSFRRTLFPATPIGVIVEIALPGTGLKDLISGF